MFLIANKQSVNHLDLNVYIINNTSNTTKLVNSISGSDLLYIKDRVSSLEFLVDTGSEVSIIPFSSKVHSNLNSVNIHLFGANGSAIRTYGSIHKCVKFSDKLDFSFTFIVADVQQPILGIDFMKKFKLSVSPCNQSLIHLPSGCVLLGIIKQKGHSSSINPIRVSLETNDFVKSLFSKYSDLINETKITKIKHSVEHYIHTDPNAKPCTAKQRQYSTRMQEVIEKSFLELERQGIVSYSESNYSSPLAVVKKPDNTYRVCGDFRSLNFLTLSDSYCIPYLNTFNNKFSGSKVFSKIDLKSAFYQVPVYKPHRHKTAVLTPIGLFEFNQLPFGLKTAAQSFQRLIDKCLADCKDYTFAFIDDIIVHSETDQKHEVQLEQVFRCLNEFGLKINTSKSEFFKQKLDFLGFEVSEQGLRPKQSKVQAINDLDTPITYKQLKRLLAMFNYYHRFMPDFAFIAEPLYKLLPNSKVSNQTINLTTQHIELIEQLKRQLVNAVHLVHPLPNATLILETDASNNGVGAVLSQVNYNALIIEPLFFFSKTFKEQLKYVDIYQKELHALYIAIKRLSRYLIGNVVLIYSDNSALVNNLRNPKDKSPMELRKLLTISQYAAEFHLISTKNNTVADCLSRVKYNLVYINKAIDYQRISYNSIDDPWIKSIKPNQYYKQQFLLVGFPPKLLKFTIYTTNTNNRLICVPQIDQQAVIGSYHKLCHAGAKSTTNLISQHFYWPNMKVDVKLFVKKCEECQLNKPNRYNIPPLNQIRIPPSRFDTVHIDIVGPLPEIDNFRYILTMLDRFTRYLNCVALTETTSRAVIEALINQWCKYFGIPATVVSDNGSNFKSKEFNDFTTKFKIKHITTTPYHPGGNGILENRHFKLKNSFRCSQSKDWLNALPIIQLAWNNSATHQNKLTPNQMLFGQNLKLPNEEHIHAPTEWSDEQWYQFIDTMLNLKPNPVQHNVLHRPNVNNELFTCKQVLVKRSYTGLENKFEGPFDVVERTSNYFIINKNGNNTAINICNLKPYYDRNPLQNLNNFFFD